MERQDDKQNFSRYYPKRPERRGVARRHRSSDRNETSFGGVPAGTKAVQLPDNGGELRTS
jgi:hypothetical protein